MGVQSLAWEDPLEKEIATHSSILAWEIPWTEEPGGLQSLVSQKSQEHDWATKTTYYTHAQGILLSVTLAELSNTVFITYPTTSLS